MCTQVENTFRAPGFQQDLYYILIGKKMTALDLKNQLLYVHSKRSKRFPFHRNCTTFTMLNSHMPL